MSLNSNEIFFYEKMQNLAKCTFNLCVLNINSMFNLCVLNIKLAQNAKQFKRLVLENFNTIIHLYSVEKALYGIRPWIFELLNISPPPPLVPASHFHTMGKIWQHIYRQKLLLAHERDDLLKMFSDFYKFDVKLIVLPKLLYF